MAQQSKKEAGALVGGEARDREESTALMEPLLSMQYGACQKVRCCRRGCYCFCLR